MQKNADAFRTISEVADDLSLPQHVLRFWETRFPQIRPLKRAGGRRYYRPNDILLLRNIRQLLYDDGYTIKGVQKLLKEQGAKGLGGGRPIIETGDDVTADAPETGAGVETAPHDGEVESAPSVLAHPDRADLQRTLATIEDCKRILDALR